MTASILKHRRPLSALLRRRAHASETDAIWWNGIAVPKPAALASRRLVLAGRAYRRRSQVRSRTAPKVSRDIPPPGDFFRPRPAGSGRSSHWEQEHPGGPAAFLDNDVQTILGGRMRNENKEKSQDLQEILAQIERVCRGLIADIERQAQIAEELTQNLPEDKRQAILKNIEETRARLAAYEARLKSRSRGA
jgi:hypothetical protein